MSKLDVYVDLLASTNPSGNSLDEVKAHHKQQIKTLMLELIGEDSELPKRTVNGSNKSTIISRNAANSVKAELREKIEAL